MQLLTLEVTVTEIKDGVHVNCTNTDQTCVSGGWNSVTTLYSIVGMCKVYDLGSQHKGQGFVLHTRILSLVLLFETHRSPAKTNDVHVNLLLNQGMGHTDVPGLNFEGQRHDVVLLDVFVIQIFLVESLLSILI